MPILRKDEPLPERPVVITLYGEPGSCKTTLGNTASKVLVIDFDRGVSRSALRQDSLVVDNWDEVISEEKKGSFKEFETIVLDTAKAALDDFLMVWAVKNDFKLQKNKLQAYGVIGDEFKRFLNSRRADGVDVIIIAHAKKDEDTKKHIPDVTGQSYQLILRVSDQVGYVSFVNNERNIQWSPTDLTIGKNTANLPAMQIPDKTVPEFADFMAGVITQVKKSIVSIGESQAEAIKKSALLQRSVLEAKDAEDMNMIIPAMMELPKTLSESIKAVMGTRSKELKLIWNKEGKVWLNPAPPAEEPKAPDNKKGSEKSTAATLNFS